MNTLTLGTTADGAPFERASAAIFLKSHEQDTHEAV